MKRWFSIGLLCLFVAACGGSESASVNCHKQYWDGTVGVCLPQGWGVVDSETLRQRGVPNDTIVAFQAEQAVSGQFPTVTVTQEVLAQPTMPDAYSKASVRSVGILPGYTLIDSIQTNVDGESVTLHIFSAQPVADEPARRFYQISTVVDSEGYTITASTPVAIEDAIENQALLILQSMTFIAIAEEE